MSNKYTGTDNYGRPKSDYLTKISDMSDEDLQDETYGMIYQSSRCANNPRADWHWMGDACYDESMKRDPDDGEHKGGRIYRIAYKLVERDHIG